MANGTVKFKEIIKRQDLILKELRQLRAISSLGRFEGLAEKGRKFAKARRITKADVLRND